MSGWSPHQGIAFDTTGALVDGQHRLAAVIEADIPVEMTVFTEVPVGAFDVLDTGKRRNAADVLAIEGEKSAVVLAAMVRTVWLYQNRPELSTSVHLIKRRDGRHHAHHLRQIRAPNLGGWRGQMAQGLSVRRPGCRHLVFARSAR